MALFKVTDIISSNVIKVDGWTWNEVDGSYVQISGFKSNGELDSFIKSRLEILIKGNEIELRKAKEIIEYNGEKCLICSVYLNEIDLGIYFPEFKSEVKSK